MAAMRASLRAYWISLAVLWAAGLSAFLLYPWKTPPGASVAAAYLLEGSLFLLLGFPAVLARLRQAVPDRWLVPLACTSAVAPYCVYSVPAVFDWLACGWVAGLALLAACWFLVMPRNWLTDLAFLLVVAIVSLARVLPGLYPAADPGLKPDFLGQMMWRRVAILSVLLFRPVPGIHLGFLPSRKEWLCGLREFLFFAPVGGALALATGFVRFRQMEGDPWRTAVVAAGTFLGMLWFVALTEEFFFRGMLQQWLCTWTARRWAGLLLTSIAFGAVHLPFRYPPLNWRFALVAAVAGVFYGRAFQSAGLRAAMVAHALVNVAWRVLFV
jgi:membrane protease YdiL (CAAX protease family)